MTTVFRSLWRELPGDALLIQAAGRSLLDHMASRTTDCKLSAGLAKASRVGPIGPGHAHEKRS